VDDVISIKKIFNNLVIKQEVGKGMFISTKNSIIISIPNLNKTNPKDRDD
jgi:hypothetical protein